MAQQEKVVPGTPLGHKLDYVSGPGTYIHNDYIYASLLGFKVITNPESESIADQDSDSLKVGMFRLAHI